MAFVRYRTGVRDLYTDGCVDDKIYISQTCCSTFRSHVLETLKMFKPSLEVMQSTSSERNNALPNRLNDVEVSLIRRKKHRAYLMESLSMNPAMSGEECATMLREHYNEHQTRAIRMLKLLARTAITQRLGISIVTVSLVFPTSKAHILIK